MRRKAERQGLHISKSRRRDARAVDFGRYYITQAWNNALLYEAPDLDAVEAYLDDDEPPHNYTTAPTHTR